MRALYDSHYTMPDWVIAPGSLFPRKVGRTLPVGTRWADGEGASLQYMLLVPSPDGCVLRSLLPFATPRANHTELRSSTIITTALPLKELLPGN